jgi:hypothetical protein
MSKDVAYDTRKALNRSMMKIPPEIVENIEKGGVDIEVIEELGIPVFKYKTQITLHGIFELEKGYSYVAGYKSIITNQNKSIGVKYVAVDAKKKNKISNAIYIARQYQYYFEKKENIPSTIHWAYVSNSTETKLRITVSVDDYENNKVAIEKLKNTFNNIPDLYIGDKNLSVYKLFGMYLVIVEIDLKAIYSRNLWAFITFLTNGVIKNQADYDEKKQFLEDLKKKKESDEKELEEKAMAEGRKIRELLRDQSPYEVTNVNELKVKSIKDAAVAMIQVATKNEYDSDWNTIGVIPDVKIKVLYFYREGNQKKWRMSDSELKSWEEVAAWKPTSSYSHSMLKETFRESVERKFNETTKLYVIKINENKVVSSSSYGRSASQSTGATSTAYTVTEQKHDKTGETIYVIRMTDRVDKDSYFRMNTAVKKLGGYYSSFVKGFVLKRLPSDEQLKEIFG